MGRTAYGVRGISLRDDDEVVAMEVVREGGTLLTVAQNGYGKRTELDEYRLQSRGGVGIINIQTSDRNGKVVGIAYVHDDDELMIISQQGMILRMRAGDVRAIGRATQGVRLIEMEEGDRSSRSRSWPRRKSRTATTASRRRRRKTPSSDESPSRSTTCTLQPCRSRVTPARASRTSPAASSRRPRLKRTVIFKSSLCSSTTTTVPTPNCACRTRMPGAQPRRRLILVLVRVGRLAPPRTRPARLPLRPYGLVRNS